MPSHALALAVVGRQSFTVSSETRNWRVAQNATVQLNPLLIVRVQTPGFHLPRRFFLCLARLGSCGGHASPGGSLTSVLGPEDEEGGSRDF